MILLLCTITFDEDPKQHNVDAGEPWLSSKNNRIKSFLGCVYCFVVFLVGAFSLKEKSPTLTVSSFFFLFFFQLTISLGVVHFSYNSAILRRRQTLLQRVPLSVFTFSRKHTQPDVPKGSPLWIFFGTVRLFFENF